ncbi:MAG: amino acid decarboxylase, partial [Oscillospiraceae bacterium]|nr:amino acid decarboxylase [Oscillospiraceae bacterium]
MNTPICSFVKAYSEKQALRLHMPGHKGQGALGIESLDITEIDGADSLYEASGIIAQSESNASELFGFPTYYSTEGSSQCIRAMLYLALLRAKQQGKKPVIAAARNVH